LKSVIKKYLLTLFVVSLSFSQTQHTIMSYNILNYPLTDTTARNPYFRTVFTNIQPDILVVIEMNSIEGVNGFFNNVLNKVSSGYSAGTFINGPDLNRAIYYKSNLFTFISNTAIHTTLRDINEFRLRHNTSGDTLIIFAVHLKANVEDSLARAAEVDSLRKRTNALPPNSNFIVLGDFNIYSSNELAYQKLKNQSLQGYFIDPLNLTGVWNNGSYAQYHTQSTRTRSFGDGATGGLDDRFDMILMSQSIINSGGISFVPGSYSAYGNDGNHFNDSINQPPNTAVGQVVANALHYATDHLPVIASFSFNSPFVELTSFTSLIEGLFNGTSMVPDTATIELRNTTFPYVLIDQAKIYLNSSGNGVGKFYAAVNGTPYYLVLKHRNAIETWSATAQTFTNGVLTYDFTTASGKAYGDNLKQIGSKWCIYSGDVNQDGLINLQDLNSVYNSNIIGVTGYTLTDVTGDMFTEIGDLTRVFINNVLGVERKRPIDFPEGSLNIYNRETE
jgi:hypothetical protein